MLERERELAAVAELLERAGGVLVIEGGVGIGKTSLLDAACGVADGLEHEILRARAWFGARGEFRVRRGASAVRAAPSGRRGGRARGVAHRTRWRGATAAIGTARRGIDLRHVVRRLARPVLAGCQPLAARRPLLIAVDDAQSADEPSLRWLSYLAPRLEGLALVMLVALRPGEPALTGASLLALNAEALSVVRPELLSEGGVSAIVRATLGARTGAITPYVGNFCSCARTATSRAARPSTALTFPSDTPSEWRSRRYRSGPSRCARSHVIVRDGAGSVGPCWNGTSAHGFARAIQMPCALSTTPMGGSYTRSRTRSSVTGAWPRRRPSEHS